jgi:Na+/melibiose symporter-like transporter
MQETKHQNAFAVLREYKGVLREILRTPQTLYTAGILLFINICWIINGTFWSIFVTKKLHIPAQDLAVFPFVKSVTMLVFFFVVIPRMRAFHFQVPLVIGFGGAILSQLLLITIPERGYGLLLVCIFLEACSTAIISPLVDQMTVRTVDPKERARIQSIIFMGIILITSPFGWIAGTLSEFNKNLPFVLNILFFAAGGVLAYIAGQASKKRLAVAAIEAEIGLP